MKYKTDKLARILPNISLVLIFMLGISLCFDNPNRYLILTLAGLLVSCGITCLLTVRKMGIEGKSHEDNQSNP